MKRNPWIGTALVLSHLVASVPAGAQEAVLREGKTTLNSYLFSDPTPVADPTNLYYPYFRFDGFSAEAVRKDWKSVELENDYLRLTLFPEVGGKVWGAIDKTTGRSFIYDNDVAKFRDIAMRGPWVSGGIEFNFGIIGHAPSSSTPVDYEVRRQPDGSVSCYVFSYEWITRTAWTVEVNLPKDKAYFTTHTTWYNQSSLEQPYYHWMNAGYRVGEDAEFCYPGHHYIGHNGELDSFPIDREGCQIGRYATNNFGNSKSYHVLGYYNDYYGVYWHGEDFGSVHHAAFDEKLGMKIFLWGLSREGGIWEDLLTDHSGQYIELQSGRVFNQPASLSGYTPYKHPSFAPQQTDEWTEYWYPVKGIQGISKAGSIGALHVTRPEGKLRLAFSPLAAMTTDVRLYADGELVETLPLATRPLEPVCLTPVRQVPEGHLKVVIGADELVYSENPADFELERPMELPEAFDWDSAYGRYVQGEQCLNQRMLDKAEDYLLQALEKDAWYAPALVRLSALYVREGRYGEAVEAGRKALSLNTYDGEANYYYGLAHRALGQATEAKAAFSIASFSAHVRTAAYEQLAEMYALEHDWQKAVRYARKSLAYNSMNLHARQVLMLAARRQGQSGEAVRQADEVLAKLPLYPPARFERLLGARKEGEPMEAVQEAFLAKVRNELPFETCIELAGWYESVGAVEEALTLYACAAASPIALYRAAFVEHQRGNEEVARQLLAKANEQSPTGVFPFRPETLKALDWARQASDAWQPRYYQALVYWTNQQPEQALCLLEQCDASDYAPLFLSRSLLKEGEARLKDLQRAEWLEAGWRVGRALLDYYTDKADWPQVVEVGRRYYGRFPQNYYIGLRYAKGLCETGAYTACISLLKKMQVLPNEGSYAGRAVYRAANLYHAIERMDKRQYKAALDRIAASREWPENLGVGKPYDDQIDDRVENYLQATVWDRQGQQALAREAYAKVAAVRPSDRRPQFQSADLLTALSLRALGRTDEADRLVASWSTDGPDRRAAWCKAVYQGDTSFVQAFLTQRKAQTEAAPWEVSHPDHDFDLLLHLFANAR